MATPDSTNPDTPPESTATPDVKTPPEAESTPAPETVPPPEAPTPSPPSANRYRAWCELCRLPNLFTAMADPLAGALVVGASWGQIHRIVPLMIASALLYAGGVVLNDWFDFKKDLEERPQRPLPSKRVPRWQAMLAAILLLAGGTLIAGVAGRTSLQVATLLLAAVVGYDIILKALPIAPLIMGMCRSFNLLLGMTLIVYVDPGEVPTLSYRIYLLIVMGVYVTGLTFFARKEAGKCQGKDLIVPTVTCCVAVATLSTTLFLFPNAGLDWTGKIWGAVLLFGITYRMIQAILTPTSEVIQRAVKTAVLGIIILDAAFAAFTVGFPASLLVAVLLVPAIWLGKRLYST